MKDTVLIAHELQHFLDDPVVCQSILNGILRWKSVGNCLVMVFPLPALPIQLQPFFHLIESLPKPKGILKICLRYFGAMWYLQFHFVCAKFFVSPIMTSF